MTSHRLRYAERATYCPNSLAKRLFHLMDEKRSNLALSADVIKGEELLALANLMGPEICILKTHVDILSDFNLQMMDELKKLAQKHNFLIFEDRKFADIGHTVKLQYEGGMYHIADWADIVNAHSLPGPGIVKGLAAIGVPKGRGLLLLAEMSSQENLLDPIYAQETLEMAEQFPEFVIGFIAQRKLSDDLHWIYMTPGVHFGERTDTLGQHYITPERAIGDYESDIIIVGRGITKASDPLKAAKKYRKAGWDAYEAEIA